MDDTALPWAMITKTLETPTIRLEVLEVGARILEWAREITKSLNTGEMPSEKENARNVKNKVAQFTLLNGTLYK